MKESQLKGITAHVFINVEKCGAVVSSGWLFLGEAICAKTKDAEAALKHLFNANLKNGLASLLKFSKEIRGRG